MLGNVLKLDPAMREEGPSLVDDFIGSLGSARAKVTGAHTLLTEVRTDAGTNSPLDQAMSASEMTNRLLLITGEAENNGTPKEAELAARIQTSFGTLRDIYEALGRTHTEVVQVEVDGLSWPLELMGEIVPNIEAYQQDL